MAPVCEVIGVLSLSIVRPPLSIRTTARIQSAGTLKRRDAEEISGIQRFTSWLALMRCSAANVDCGTTGTCGTTAFQVV